MNNFTSPLFLISLLLIFVMAGCKSANEAEKHADQFYEYLKDHDYESIYEMFDEEALKDSPIEVFEGVFKQKESYGKLNWFEKKVGFNTKTANGLTFVTLDYKCTYDKLTLHERLVFVKRKENFKIYSYEFNENKRKLKS